MSSYRFDGWTPEEEKILVETILRTLRHGGTQLSAFQEAGEKLKRTPTACGHRWNRDLRKNYMHEIENAKKEFTTQTGHTHFSESQIEPECDSNLHGMETLTTEIRHLQKAFQEKMTINDRLCQDITLLREEISSLTAELVTLRNDYLFLLRYIKDGISRRSIEQQNAK